MVVCRALLGHSAAMQKLLTLGVALAACTSSNPATDSGTPDGSTTDAASSDGTTPDGAAPTTNSEVIAGTFGNGGLFGGADFSSPSSLVDSCPTLAVGTCILYDCGPTQNAGNYTTPSDDPGTLTISGGSPNTVLTLAASNGTYSASKASTGSSFPPGTSMTIAATGATVPAFQDTLMIPAAPTINTPALDAGALSITRAADFSVSWSGGAASVIAVSISDGSPKFVGCEFQTSAASGVVPTALLSHLATGAGQVSFNAYNIKTIVAGAYNIKLWMGQTMSTVNATLN